MNNILVTGSSGMIGTALCEKLIREKINFVGIDKVENEWNREIQDKTVIFDLRNRDIESLANDLKPQNIGMVVHLAANARVWDLIQDTSLAIDNIEMTNNVYLLAERLKVKNVVIASSREVYGNALQKTEGKIKESDASHLKVTNQYAAGKLCTESLASAYKTTHNIDSVVIRFSNVYGRYDKSDRFVPLVIRNILKNKNTVIYGGKEKEMDFTYIDDSIEGLWTIMKNFESLDKEKINVFNVSTGRATSLYDVANKLMDKLGRRTEISLLPNRPGEPMHYVADTSLIENLGYKAKFDIEKGLDKSIEYYKDLYQNIG